MHTLRMCLSLAGTFALIILVRVAPATAQDIPLYACAEAGDTRTLVVGITICDARPTESLTQRMDADNLQLREGALITEVIPGGVGPVAGLQSGDVIYRVGGVNVSDNSETADRLALLEANADAVVNFLRKGRPYRVKLRSP